MDLSILAVSRDRGHERVARLVSIVIGLTKSAKGDGAILHALPLVGSRDTRSGLSSCLVLSRSLAGRLSEIRNLCLDTTLLGH